MQAGAGGLEFVNVAVKEYRAALPVAALDLPRVLDVALLHEHLGRVRVRVRARVRGRVRVRVKGQG